MAHFHVFENFLLSFLDNVIKLFVASSPFRMTSFLYCRLGVKQASRNSRPALARWKGTTTSTTINRFSSSVPWFGLWCEAIWFVSSFLDTSKMNANKWRWREWSKLNSVSNLVSIKDETQSENQYSSMTKWARALRIRLLFGSAVP